MDRPPETPRVKPPAEVRTVVESGRGIAPNPGQSLAAKLWEQGRTERKAATAMTAEQLAPFRVENVFAIEYPTPQPLDGPRRNLAYHLCPFRNGTWRRSVEQIVRRLWMFDGRRVVAILTGTDMDDPAEARSAFAGHDVEFITRPNDPTLREVATWEPLISRCVEAAGVTYYAHSKGVSRNVNDGETVHRWARTMHETCLDYWPFVARLLDHFPIAGSFLKHGRGFTSQSAWHYSGAFFWMRNDDLRRREWKRIDRMWWGVEAWPGLHYADDEAGCIFGEGKVPTLDLYSMRNWVDNLWPQYVAWQRSHQPFRLT
jgi:hypothetical protein